MIYLLNLSFITCFNNKKRVNKLKFQILIEVWNDELTADFGWN